MTKPLAHHVLLPVGLVVCAVACVGRPLRAESHANSATVLGVQGSRFTVNKHPTFLLGISYYGALGAPDDFIFESHRRAVETVVNALKQHRNWYLDLANERDVRDDRYVRVGELKQLRELVRRLDPQRLVTASFGGHDLSKRDVRDSLIDAGHDFLSVHRPRNAQSPKQTQARTRELLSFAAGLNRPAPVHHQEPFRRGYAGWEPAAADFLTDLRGAVDGAAAGWCFHNGSQRNASDGQPRRAFDLRQRRLIDQLDAEERIVLQKAQSVLAEARANFPPQKSLGQSVSSIVRDS